VEVGVLRSLVVYGTKYGTTAEVAEFIADRRGEEGPVEVLELDRKRRAPIGDQDLVVIGTNIMMGSWDKRVKRFVQENRDVLSGNRVALFVCCGDLLDPEKGKEARGNYIERPLDELGFETEISEIFGGVIDFSRYGMMVKALMKNVMRSSEGDGFDTAKVHDLRDWERIGDFARSLCPP
jgi:menaquinone-dependent protoporphyrinogen oxidase